MILASLCLLVVCYELQFEKVRPKTNKQVVATTTSPQLITRRSKQLAKLSTEDGILSLVCSPHNEFQYVFVQDKSVRSASVFLGMACSDRGDVRLTLDKKKITDRVRKAIGDASTVDVSSLRLHQVIEISDGIVMDCSVGECSVYIYCRYKDMPNIDRLDFDYEKLICFKGFANANAKYNVVSYENVLYAHYSMTGSSRDVYTCDLSKVDYLDESVGGKKIQNQAGAVNKSSSPALREPTWEKLVVNRKNENFESLIVPNGEWIGFISKGDKGTYRLEWNRKSGAVYNYKPVYTDRNCDGTIPVLCDKSGSFNLTVVPGTKQQLSWCIVTAGSQNPDNDTSTKIFDYGLTICELLEKRAVKDVYDKPTMFEYEVKFLGYPGLVTNQQEILACVNNGISTDKPGTSAVVVRSRSIDLVYEKTLITLQPNDRCLPIGTSVIDLRYSNEGKSLIVLAFDAQGKVQLYTFDISNILRR